MNVFNVLSMLYNYEMYQIFMTAPSYDLIDIPTATLTKNTLRSANLLFNRTKDHKVLLDIYDREIDPSNIGSEASALYRWLK